MIVLDIVLVIGIVAAVAGFFTWLSVRSGGQAGQNRELRAERKVLLQKIALYRHGVDEVRAMVSENQDLDRPLSVLVMSRINQIERDALELE